MRTISIFSPNSEVKQMNKPHQTRCIAYYWKKKWNLWKSICNSSQTCYKFSLSIIFVNIPTTAVIRYRNVQNVDMNSARVTHIDDEYRLSLLVELQDNQQIRPCVRASHNAGQFDLEEQTFRQNGSLCTIFLRPPSNGQSASVK